MATPIQRARRLASRGRRRVRDLRGPTLSVVVPVFDGGELLDAALGSLLGQRYRHLDVVVVDDGSRDDSRARAERWAARDPRVRVLHQANAGQSVARNTGVAAATGEYLTFVDADDLVTHDGLDVAVRGLEASGSDVAVMPYQRLEDDTVRPAAPWIRALHARPARGITVSQRPDVMLNAVACAKVFRRTFWDAAGLRFPPGVIYEDQILTAHAYREAAAIDITGEVAYSWRRQATSTSQGHASVENLLARMDAADESLRLLETLPDVRVERAVQLLRHNVPNSALKLERADDDYLAVLARRVPRLADAVPADRLAREVPAELRVLLALLRHAADGDHEPVWRFVRAEGLQSQLHPSGPEPAGWSVRLPGWGEDPAPDAAYVLTAEQVALRTRLGEVRRSGPDLEIDLQAWFGHVDLERPRLHVQALGGRTAVTADLVPSGDDAVFTSRAGTRRLYAGSGWTARLRLPGGTTSLELMVDLRSGPFEGVRVLRVTVPAAV